MIEDTKPQTTASRALNTNEYPLQPPEIEANRDGRSEYGRAHFPPVQRRMQCRREAVRSFAGSSVGCHRMESRVGRSGDHFCAEKPSQHADNGLHLLPVLKSDDFFRSAKLRLVVLESLAGHT